MEKGKIAIGLAVCISSAAIFTCLGFVVRMHTEITELYQECMADMQEFNVRVLCRRNNLPRLLKKLTNDAWTEMMQILNEPQQKQPFDSIFRSTRQSSSQCSKYE